jgi:hypothetical protein
VDIKKGSALSTRLDYDEIVLDPIPIGDGAFARVDPYQGRLLTVQVYVGMWRSTEVAVKLLKSQNLSKEEMVEVERETTMMNKLR